MSFQKLSAEATGRENTCIADSLYTSGNYMDAAIEYERIIYESGNLSGKNKILYKKALCYKYMEQYDKAQHTLMKINFLRTKRADHLKYRYELALCSYLASDFNQVEKDLRLLMKFDPKPKLQQKIYLLQTLNSIMQGKIDLAERIAADYVHVTCTLNQSEEECLKLKDDVEALFNKKNRPKLRKEKVFNVVKIVPGMGQIYAGQTAEGLFNMGMNLAAFSFGVYQVWKGFYLTGYFVGTLSINKFYFGGLTRAEHLLEIHNETEIRKFHEQVRNAIEE
jgi:tetratricopeptide (TPR) repeat protein